MNFTRLFTNEGVCPYSTVEWVKAVATVSDDSGKKLFEQKDIEVPRTWNQNAIDIVVTKYFAGKLDTPERETSVKQLIGRVVKKITQMADYILQDDNQRQIFSDELTYILLHQMASFNSPVWFNVGVVEPKPQGSACFISSVEDNMDSILEQAKIEGNLFKYGSGVGTNMSTLRSSVEDISGGGKASGPVSFMKSWDANGGVIKSGGKRRRSAIMRVLSIEHPDIEEFVDCKTIAEKMAHTLIQNGWPSDYNGITYSSMPFQNANHSVRVNDAFMSNAINKKRFFTKLVTTGEDYKSYNAYELLEKIANAAHFCGDPGIQYDNVIQEMHTCKASGFINASNPCSEYLFLDDSACNLASIRLVKYLLKDSDGKYIFDLQSFYQTIKILITAMEALVGGSSYPSEKIEKNSHKFRPLGLGYADLGTLLMLLGLPYDSPQARAIASAITSYLSAGAYATSAELAESCGAFEGFEENKESMLEVISIHKRASNDLKTFFERSKSRKWDNELINFPPENNDVNNILGALKFAANDSWDYVLKKGEVTGFRNSQVTVLAPTGTIAFAMQCDTTGVEPEISLIKYKKLAGGGFMKIVNSSVDKILLNLNYPENQAEEILKYILANETIEGAPYIKEEHLNIFDCSLKPAKGKRYIRYKAHYMMMAAIQPFLSGAISKTVNMPNDATTEDIMNVYIDAWRYGLKCIAVYRDGSKMSQPLNTSKDANTDLEILAAKIQYEKLKEEFEVLKGKYNSLPLNPTPVRKKLPDNIPSFRHKFNINGIEGYIQVGIYPDTGDVGELFIKIAKEGSLASGFADSFATLFSIALQWGVPLYELVYKFKGVSFEPHGFTTNNEIRMAKSIVDYVMRYLEINYINKKNNVTFTDAEKAELDKTSSIVEYTSKALKMLDNKKINIEKIVDPELSKSVSNKSFNNNTEFSAYSCNFCSGTIFQPAGTCKICISCGETTGCS